MIAVILILLLLVFTYCCITGKYFVYNENYINTTIQPKPYIKLFERFNQKNLVFDYDPLLADPTSLYLRTIVKVNVKSIDLNIPLMNDGFDNIRTIKIWNIYNGDNTSSSESDFYNMYTENEIAYGANTGKYQKLISMKAGNRIKLNLTVPIKKVFIEARF